MLYIPLSILYAYARDELELEVGLVKEGFLKRMSKGPMAKRKKEAGPGWKL